MDYDRILGRLDQLKHVTLQSMISITEETDCQQIVRQRRSRHDQRL